MINNQLSCPKHDHVDQIQKVSSVFSSGVTSGTYSGPSVAVGTPIGKGQTTVTGGYTTLSGGSQSLLSSRLAPPAKPSAQGASGWRIGCGLVLFAFGTLATLLGLAFIFGMLSSISSGVKFDSGNAFGMVFAIVFWAVGGVGGGVAILRSAGQGAKKRADEAAAQMPKWETAMVRWNRLYYCARDDIVFDPDDEERTFVTPEQMMGYIYR